MKPPLRLLVTAAFFATSLIGTPTSASFVNEPFPTDDTDLSGFPATPPLKNSPHIEADQIHVSEIPSGMEIEVVREENNALAPVEGLSLLVSGEGTTAVTDSNGVATFSACTVKGRNVTLKAELRTSHFEIQTPDQKLYQLSLEARCGTRTQLHFKTDTHGGQAMGIWQIAFLGRKKLAETVGLEFWKSNLKFVWPSGGDYYFLRSVHLTRGDHWDVVGHEMGHAIYDLAAIGALGGGSHKIDECYTPTLAFSEGWASYFSAWVRVPLNDPDAKFQYLVPRRAPIRFENVPSDVCHGPNNEWRVTSFLWDLVDLHSDGEHLEETFALLWNALKNTRTRSAGAAASLLEKAGMKSEDIQIAWVLNFIEPRSSQ